MNRTIRWDSWDLRAEADRRFRRIMLLVALPIALLALIVNIWQFSVEEREAGEFDSTQYVQLLPEQAELAPQVEEPKPTPDSSKQAPQQAKPAKPEVKPDKKAPAPPVPTKSARDVASKSGVLEFADQLADLRDQNLSAITTLQPLNSNTITSKGGIGAAASGGSADAIASSAASGSGGIGGAGNGSVTSTQSGSGLGSRRTNTVKSPLGFGTEKRAGPSGIAAGRTPSEIQAVFNKNQGPFYAIYNRAARENESIGRGKIVVSLTIAPSGAVSACSIVSSSYSDSEFERKVVERVKLLNFGAKDVPAFSMNYPISFIPQ